MIPILYDSAETAFTSNGIGRIPCTECIVKEERNGIYECKFKVPITEPIYQHIQERSFIACIHDDKKDVQPFEIYGRSAPLKGVVTFYARHISYKLSRVIIKPFTAGSVTETFLKLPQFSVNDNPFTFWTDKSTTGSFVVDKPATAKSLLMGSEGSVLDVYGTGEYEFDKFAVKLYLHRGVDTGVQIRYGKNLTDLVHDKDISESYSGIAPYWQDAETGETVMLPEVIIISTNGAEEDELVSYTQENITDNTGEEIAVAALAVNPLPADFSMDFDEKPTVEQLRQLATSRLNASGAWMPRENLTVDFVALWQTDEYAGIAPLQRVSLCDRVSVYYPELGVNAVNQQVISVTYDVLAERYTKMELGKPKSTIADIIKAEVTETVLKRVPSMSIMEAAIDKATNLILGGTGSHAVWGVNADGQPNELFFMDTTDPATAVHVLRINGNGIGFSSNGINGPFSTAWTIDGSFVASFITSGILNANLVKAGIISDLAGKNYWNLETGEISISYDSDPGSEVTQADLTRVETNARNWASDAETAAKGYTDDQLTGALDGYATESFVTGQISASAEGIRTEFGESFAVKGDTVSQTVTYYYQSTSPTQLFGGSWSTTAPQWVDGLYIWEKHRYIKADNTYTEDAPVCVTGNSGLQGTDGEDAIYLYITSNAPTSTAKETPAVVTLTACIGKGDEADIDPYGTAYIYGWYKTRDGEGESYYRSGKNITISIDVGFCEDRASLRFTLVTAEDLQLADNTGDLIQTHNGDVIGVA
jgi:phage-related protein